MSLNRSKPFSNSLSMSLHMFSALSSSLSMTPMPAAAAETDYGISLCDAPRALSCIWLSVAKAAVWGYVICELCRPSSFSIGIGAWSLDTCGVCWRDICDTEGSSLSSVSRSSESAGSVSLVGIYDYSISLRLYCTRSLNLIMIEMSAWRWGSPKPAPSRNLIPKPRSISRS